MPVPIGSRFRALADFFSDETQSHYVRGLGYNVETQKLAGLVERWISEGRVELGGDAAIMTGKG